MGHAIEGHIERDVKVSAKLAIKEAFSSLKEGGAYTWKLVITCGFCLGLLSWIGNSFNISRLVAVIAQGSIEIIYIYIWHRFFLLAEKKGLRYLNEQLFTRFFWRSLSYGLLVLVLISLGVVWTLFWQTSSSMIITVFMIVVGNFFLSLIVMRTLLVFPAIAAGNRHISFNDVILLSTGYSFVLMRGYLGMMLLIFCVFIIPIIVAVYYFYILVVGQIVLPYAVYLLTLWALGMMTATAVLLWAGLNSSFYRQLGGVINKTSTLENLTGKLYTEAFDTGSSRSSLKAEKR